jgi:peptidoglycan hydrolase-like protein with peptidoglycan-binding domain
MTLIKPTKVYLVSLTFILALLSLLLFRGLSYAAFDNVTLTTDTVITVNSLNLNVSGSSAELDTIVVDSTTFTVTLQPGSSITVTSSDKADFTANVGSVIGTETCGSSESTLTLTSTALSNIEAIVTPTTSVSCTKSFTTTSTSSGGGGSAPGTITFPGSGGGGGGSSSVTTTTPTPTTPATTPATTPSTTPTPSGKVPTFSSTRTIRLGMTGADVLALQQILNSDPDTRVASTGVGSSGNETNYFGNLTRVALRKFQAKHGIASSGDEDSTGYGLVGPKTRAKLNELSGKSAVSTPPPSPTPTTTPTSSPITFSKGLSRGQTNGDIKALQQLLNSDPDTQVASTGVGSPGNETSYFGSLTERAVQKFQEKYGIAGAGVPGYGYVGPKTRAKLNELFGQ